MIEAVRNNGGYYSVNVAHLDAVETIDVGPIEIYNPTNAGDREQLVAAVSEANEIATAVPSVKLYATDGEGSLHRILAAGLARREHPVVIYTAENHIAAAAELRRTLLAAASGERSGAWPKLTAIVDTVIGKMSVVITDPEEMRTESIRPMTPGFPRAFLVESFRHILTSPIRFAVEASFHRGLDFLDERPSLIPFEEAKLYGHNATHALAGYLAAALGCVHVAELAGIPGSTQFLRDAFIDESGSMLKGRWRGSADLFTETGFARYVDDLLARMLNPHLRDLVSRLTRDPERKLGWNDRLVGVMRHALGAGTRPRRFALGVAAALHSVDPCALESHSSVSSALTKIWRGDEAERDAGEAAAVIELVTAARPAFSRWVKDRVLDADPDS